MSDTGLQPGKQLTLGLLAHVDAGKTTLAEAILYTTGKLRQPGRVDRGDTAMDTHELERSRGITIFLSQAMFRLGNWTVSLLDTPGHVDFSSETERVLQVLDGAILVISGLDGVQAHTRTLWRLLEHYRVPVYLFITKMDFARRSREDLLAELQRELSPACLEYGSAALKEQVAMGSEALLEEYLETGTLPGEATARSVQTRQVFPCWFGSGLKLEGVEEFLLGMEECFLPRTWPEAFGARVFKISHDPQGNRLTWLKLTGGMLKVKDSIRVEDTSEKVDQIRLYTGSRFTPTETVYPGGICAVTGLSRTREGQGLGTERLGSAPRLEPVMRYRILLPEGEDPVTMLRKLRQLEEEDPQLRLEYDSALGEIGVSLMGEVQAEILKSLIARRFGVEVSLDRGRVLYKETIDAPVEGVGHYEPLRHYAEVHLILEPLPRGSGLQFASVCSEDALDRNWQRLILTHLAEKTHLGVLTGSPITDMRITLASGRAHLKHTEGGDFRQATYRAVRQGLMQARSVLLEPWYAFRLELPPEQLGRAIYDIRARHGTLDSPEDAGEMILLRGRAPVTGLNGYAAQVAAYTGGRGRLTLEQDGYDLCPDPESAVAETGYEPERDLENSPDSVFCAHGGGFPVKWDKVKDYMHLESCLKAPRPVTPRLNRQNLQIDEKELEAILLREFGPIRRPQYRRPPSVTAPAAQPAEPVTPKKLWYIIDGYNVIFAWEDLRALAERELEDAREKLMHLLVNFSAYTRYEVVLVFDGYRVPRNRGEKLDYHGIRVVYTEENETGDAYIERLVHEIGRNEQVRVVTSDGLIRLAAVRTGLLRLSAQEFEEEVSRISRELGDLVKKQTAAPSRVGEAARITALQPDQSGEKE